MSSKKYFGTDGIRGVIGSEPMTPRAAMQFGWALASILAKKHERPKIIVGKDTRISGYILESAMQAGIAAAGADVLLLGPMPTPAIAYLTNTLDADAGVVISASHNPSDHNGFKVFTSTGKKLSNKEELELESYMERELRVVDNSKLGRARRVNDAVGRYVEYCKGRVDFSISLAGLRIVVDCANGATYHCAPQVFAELGAEVITINAEPDGFNINRECGATNTNALRQEVLRQRADLGIALDGDGDRVIILDSDGSLVDGDSVIYIIARNLHRQGSLGAGVVGTKHSNSGLARAISNLGAEFLRAEVGDRHVSELLERNGWALGGESSGHVINRTKSSTGDGIITALQVLESMWQQGTTLKKLLAGLEKVAVLEHASEFHGDRKKLMESKAMKELLAKLEPELEAQGGRLLVRPSGTEQIIRILIECDDEQLSQRCLDDILSVIRKHSS